MPYHNQEVYILNEQLMTYTLTEVAKLTGISRSTLYRDIEEGRLVGFRSGKVIRYNSQQIKDYIELRSGDKNE